MQKFNKSGIVYYLSKGTLEMSLLVIVLSVIRLRQLFENQNTDQTFMQYLLTNNSFRLSLLLAIIIAIWKYFSIKVFKQEKSHLHEIWLGIAMNIILLGFSAYILYNL